MNLVVLDLISHYSFEQRHCASRK